MVNATRQLFLKKDPALNGQAPKRAVFGKSGRISGFLPLSDGSIMRVQNYRIGKSEIKSNPRFKLPEQYVRQIYYASANALKGIYESAEKARHDADSSIFFPGREHFESAITEIGGFKRGEVSCCHCGSPESKKVGLLLSIPGATRIKKLNYVDSRNNGTYEIHNVHIFLDYSDLDNLKVALTKYHSPGGRVKDEVVFPLKELPARMREFATELYSIRRARK